MKINFLGCNVKLVSCSFLAEFICTWGKDAEKNAWSCDTGVSIPISL